MPFPVARWKILQEYQVELEKWVETAPITEIKQYFTEIHGLIYPDDWRQVQQSHISPQVHSIHSCEYCQELLSAILTISQLNRPDLKVLWQD